MYELALVQETPIEIELCDRTPEGAQAALTLTCRQIRTESLPIFYGLDTFCLDANDGFDPKLARSSASIVSKVHMIKNIEIIVCGHGNYFRFCTNHTGENHLKLEMMFEDGWEPLHPPEHCIVRQDVCAEGQAVLDVHFKISGPQARWNGETFIKLVKTLSTSRM